MIYGIGLTTLMDIDWFDCRRSELPWSREAQQATVENKWLLWSMGKTMVWGTHMLGNLHLTTLLSGPRSGPRVIPFRCLLMQPSMDPLVQEPWTHGCQQFLWVHSCIHGLPPLHYTRSAWSCMKEISWKIQKELKHCCMAASWKTFENDTKNIKQPLVMDQAMATAIQKSQSSHHRTI